MKRKYNFELPYDLSPFLSHFAKDKLIDDGIYYNLPKDLQDKLDLASHTWEDVYITKQMCDEINEETWIQIADKLNLDWEYVNE